MSRSRIHVLLVDDEPTIHKALAMGLEGMSLTSAMCAEEALQVLDEERFDVALVDMHLPDCPGLSLITRMSSLPSPPRSIVLTAYPSLETAIQAIRLRVSDYIPKPFQLEELTTAIRRAARERHSEGASS